MEVRKAIEFVVREFELDEEMLEEKGVNLSGVLTIIYDPADKDDLADVVYFNIGNQQLGWMDKKQLIEVCKTIVAELEATESTDVIKTATGEQA